MVQRSVSLFLAVVLATTASIPGQVLANPSQGGPMASSGQSAQGLLTRFPGLQVDVAEDAASLVFSGVLTTATTPLQAVVWTQQNLWVDLLALLGSGADDNFDLTIDTLGPRDNPYGWALRYSRVYKGFHQPQIKAC